MGERLQRALEAYVVPGPLRGRDFGRGPVAKRITPIFRDRWDADASSDLGATLQAALQASDALIVLCSPAAAQSRWVAEEIRTFKRFGRAERIYAVLVAGLPARFDAESAPLGAFPPALFEHWDASGALTGSEDREPLAPDARADGDGLQFTILKLVAALTAIPLTTLTQRQAEAERRERNTARWIAVAMSVLALGAAVGAWSSWRASEAARARLENAVEMAARRVDDAAGFQDRYGVPSAVIHELLDGAHKDFDELTRDASGTPSLGLQRARLDRLLAQLYEAAGDGVQHRELAQLAYDRLAQVQTRRRIDAPRTWFARLPSSRSVDVERILILEALGQAAAAEGDRAGARARFEAMARQADALAASAGDATPRILAANARSDLARLAYDEGDLETALKGLGDAATLLDGDSGDATVAGDLAKIRSDEAEMLLELGRHGEALARQRAAVAALEQAARATPEARRTLAAALARQGDMRLAAERDLDGARADYLAARSTLSELLASDGARTDIKRDLSLAHERAGDALLQARDVAGAEEEFAACLRLRRELVAHDTSNAEWRRDLSVALERVGAVSAELGRHAASAAAFEEALVLRTTAWQAHPDNPIATRDLAVLWMLLGKARAGMQAPLADIDAAYGKAIGLLTPLVEQAAPESRWRRDLAVAHAERGEERRRAGRVAQATEDFRRALALISGLLATAPGDRQLLQDEGWLRRRLSDKGNSELRR